MSDTLQKLKDLLIGRLKLNVAPDQITAETTLFGDNSLGFDSIDVLELVVGIKKEFGVEIADRKVAEQVFTSVGAIVEYIEKNK